jgi:hypothetical protein
MNLYIQVDENGNTANHPAFEDNLLQAFGSIPSNWEPFIRVQQPTPNTYQILENTTSTYQKINGTWTDVWQLRDMTDIEKATKQQAVKDAWSSNPNANNFTAWTFDESTCAYIPPQPKPTDTPPTGQTYRWQGNTNSWQLAPVMPTDGKMYTWNFTTWVWDEVTS